MQIKGGHVTHFPDLTQVSNTFPNLDGFGITFTGLKKIEREKLKNLSRIKFFWISDNAIEEIPGDTFYDLKNMELIDICRNKIKRLEPTWLTSMSHLKVFKARTNQFQSIPADMFQNNAQLEEILFDGNRIATNEVDYSALKNLKLVAILKNQCIDLEYCQDPKKPKCIRSLRQFNYLVNGYCGIFN
jgi:Leucine-rich repeat (LRR) protein